MWGTLIGQGTVYLRVHDNRGFVGKWWLIYDGSKFEATEDFKVMFPSTYGRRQREVVERGTYSVLVDCIFIALGTVEAYFGKAWRRRSSLCGMSLWMEAHIPCPTHSLPLSLPPSHPLHHHLTSVPWLQSLEPFSFSSISLSVGLQFYLNYTLSVRSVLFIVFST